MKFRKFGKIVLASVVSLAMTGLTACVVQTGDFVYVTSSKNDPGQINVFKADINSGTLKALSVSPYTMRYRNPVALVVSPDNKNLYVAYRDDNVIQQYGIGTDGKIYPLNTYNTPGAYPISLAINPAGTQLYVVDTYQPGYTNDSPGPGALIVYPIKSGGALDTAMSNGSVQYFPVGMIPTVLNTTVATTGAAPNTAPTSVLVQSGTNAAGTTFIVVATWTKSGTQSSTTKGAVYAFYLDSTSTPKALGTGDTTLATADAGAGIYGVGTEPSAILMDSNAKYVYVTDFSKNVIWAYTISSSGLTSLTSTGYATGNNPLSLTMDPRNKFIYSANYTDGSLNGYQIGSTGALTAVSSGSTAMSTVATTGAEPSCVFIEPRSGKYVYTTNFLSNSVTGFQMNTSTGTLSLVQGSPFTAASQPTCGIAVIHGKQALSSD